MTDFFDQLERIGAEEAEDKIAARKRRAARCGWPYEYVDPHDGSLRQCTYVCNVPEFCYACAERRAEGERNKISYASGGRSVMIAEGSEQDMNLMKRRLKRKEIDCRRYPLEDGAACLIHFGNDQDGGERKELDQIDWMRITQQPAGKNISGKIKSPPKPPVEDAGASELIRIPTIRYVQELSQEQKEEAWTAAVLNTSHLDPDIEIIKDCVFERINEYKRQIQRLGGDSNFFVWKPMRIYEDKIDWSPYNESIQKKCARQAMYHSGMMGNWPEPYLVRLYKQKFGEEI